MDGDPRLEFGMSSDDLPSSVNSLFAQWRNRLEEKRKRHQAVIESPEYIAQLTRLGQLTTDFVITLRLCWIATTRAGDWVDRSLFNGQRTPIPPQLGCRTLSPCSCNFP
jgi:hypothetical protein